MQKCFSSTIPTYSTMSPTTPPFLNSMLQPKTPHESVITGRKILNTPLGLSSRESSEHLNKFPIVIESIKGRRTPKEGRILKRIDETIKKPEKSEKPQKKIQMRPQKRLLSSENKEVLKEKSLNQQTEKKTKEKAEALIKPLEESKPPHAKPEKPKAKKTKKPKKQDENQVFEPINELKTGNKEKPRKKQPKKKKKKKKAAPRAANIELIKSVESPPPEHTSISKLLMKSLEEFKAKKIQSLSNKKQRSIQNHEKNRTQQERNQEIRRSNLERFLKRQELDPFASKNFKPPWGLDQMKFKRYYLSKFLKEFEISPEMNINLSRNNNLNKAPREEIVNDEVRRTRLGLEFLKGMSEDNIEQLIRRSKEKAVERDFESPSLPKKKIYTEDDIQEIRRFMEKKREQIETQNIQTLLQDFLSQEKIKQNLQSLQEEVKGIFQSKQSKSVNKHFRSSQNAPELLSFKPNDNDNNENVNEEPDSKEFSLLYQEYKNFIREKSPEKNQTKKKEKESSKNGTPTKTLNPLSQINLQNNQIFKGVVNGQSSQNVPLQRSSNVIERYEGIKEKFDTLARRFEKYIEHKSVEEEQGGLRRNENFLENIEEEKDHLKSSDLQDSNKQDSFVPSKPKFPQSNELEAQPMEEHLQSIENPSSLKEHEENEDMDSEIWGENLQILENIAIMIQKVWRGYRTRKILDEYFEIILNGEYMENPEADMHHEGGPANEVIIEDELEDQMESMHKENKQKKKSRSADVYDSGNEKKEVDDYKLQEEFFNNKKAISHNILYNRPDSKTSDEFEQDKIMHISDIMEDEGNNSKSQEKSKELSKFKRQEDNNDRSKEVNKNKIQEDVNEKFQDFNEKPKNPNKAKKQEEFLERPNEKRNKKQEENKDDANSWKKPFIDEVFYKKPSQEESPKDIPMPNADIISSADEFRKRLKEETEVELQTPLQPDFNLDDNNLHTDKTFEESLSKKDYNNLMLINDENSLEYTRPSQKSKKPRYSDSEPGSNDLQNLGYKKKNKLMLDVEEIEKEHQIHEKLISDISNKNSDKPDLSEIRKTLCSEKLLREQANRNMQFKPLKIKPSSESLEEAGLKDSRDSKSKAAEENLSIFEQEPFKDFTFKMYQDMVNNDMRKSSESLTRETYEEWKKTHVEKKTPKSSGLSKKGLMEKWVNPEESQKKEQSNVEQNKWNSPFYGFKKTQRDLDLMQRSGNQAHSYYNSYYSDEGINPTGEYDKLAFLSKSWHGFNSQKKPSSNIMNQLSEIQSKNIKIIDQFEVKEIKSELEKPEANLSASSYRQQQPQESPQNILNFEASSISKSRKKNNENDSNRVPTEEDNDFEFKDDKEDNQLLFINPNPDLSTSENKQSKSPPIPAQSDENIQGFDVLPLDKSLESSNNLINNEVVIRDEQAYNKDLKVNTVANSIIEGLLTEFEGELQYNEVILNKFMNFVSNRQMVVYKPINTSVYAVDEYLNILNNFVRERYAKEFLQNINQAYDNDPLVKLKIYNEAKFESNNKDFQLKPVDILSNEVFVELDRLMQEEESNNDQCSVELDRLHKQLLFDCMNESLEYFRPFDIRGKPSPWKLNQKKLTYSDIDASNMDIVLEQAKNKVIEWSLFQCGMLAEGNEAILNYDLLNQVKQERLERMIINEIYEKEEKWITYDDWESVAQIEISDLILEGLVFETVKDLMAKRGNANLKSSHNSNE